MAVLYPDGNIKSCLCSNADAVAHISEVQCIAKHTCDVCQLLPNMRDPFLAIISRDQRGSLDAALFGEMVKKLAASCNRSHFFFLRDPFEHPDTVSLIKAACQFGDKVIIESPFGHNGPSLVNLIKSVSCSAVSFRVPFGDPGGTKVQFPRMLGRVLLVAERGFEVVVVDECGCLESLMREFSPHGIVVENRSSGAC